MATAREPFPAFLFKLDIPIPSQHHSADQIANMQNTRERKPHKNLTRSDGLPLAVQRLLILACEDRDLTEAEPAQVVDSNKAFGASGTDLRRKCRDKVRYYRKIRDKEPDLYWYVLKCHCMQICIGACSFLAKGFVFQSAGRV